MTTTATTTSRPEPGSRNRTARPGRGYTHRHVELDELSEHWRIALFRAQDALHALQRSTPMSRLPADELASRSRRLGEEREATARLIDTIAHDEHVSLLHRLRALRATTKTLGLPEGTEACVFDLDGVLTPSERLHEQAWKLTLDGFLVHYAERTGNRHAFMHPFTDRDYYGLLHGRSRIEGIHDFLASRGIRLPYGEPDDPAESDTIRSIARRKNAVMQRLLDREGIAAFEGSRLYLEAAREAEVACAVVSPSSNTREILHRSALTPLVEVRVDGQTIRAERLRSKPAPDTLITACELLAVDPAHAVSFETTAAGVQAARAAGFSVVVGVDRGDPAPLPVPNADLVVGDLVELLDPAWAPDSDRLHRHPHLDRAPAAQKGS